MSIPSNWSVVRVTAHYMNPDGNPSQGKVEFDIVTPGRILDPDANVIVVPKTIVAELDESGRIEVDLPASNDPDVSPRFVWRVREKFLPNRYFTYEIEVPYDTTSLDLSQAGEVSSGEVIYHYVSKSGDTMTGYLTLNADPMHSLHAATKRYVDISRSSAVSYTDAKMAEHIASEDPHGDREYARELVETSVPKTLEHVVTEPSSNWVITHNMDRYPDVTLIGPDNERAYTNIHYADTNSLTLTFAQPTTGRAILH